MWITRRGGKPSAGGFGCATACLAGLSWSGQRAGSSRRAPHSSTSALADLSGTWCQTPAYHVLRAVVSFARLVAGVVPAIPVAGLLKMRGHEHGRV